jgi:hypothetical protein
MAILPCMNSAGPAATAVCEAMVQKKKEGHFRELEPFAFTWHYLYENRNKGQLTARYCPLLRSRPICHCVKGLHFLSGRALFFAAGWLVAA